MPTRPLLSSLLFALLSVGLLPSAAGQDPEPPKNVLIVSFDTTRADAFGCYGSERGASPTVDRLAAEGVRFAAAFSPVPVTLPAHTTLLTGLDPPRHRVRDNAIYSLSSGAETLAERLHAKGFRTFAHVASMVLLPRYGLDQGFQTYAIGRLGLEGGESIRREADAVARAALSDLGGEEPFLGFVHFYDPHQPITLPVDLVERFDGDDYHGAVFAADRALGMLVAELERLGRLERTLIVVTADHGEGRGEHDESTHGTLLYDQTQHVPLVLRHPSLGTGVVVEDRIATLADVVPTVLDALGLEVPGGLDGRSLVGVLRDEGAEPGEAYLETLVPELAYDWAPLRGLRTLRWKLVIGARPHLFQLDVDPGEAHDLASERPEVVTKLGERLAELREGHGPALERQTNVVTGDELRVLGGLGYVGHDGDEERAPTTAAPDPYDLAATLTRILDTQARLEGGDVDGAIEGFEEVVERVPNTFRVLQALGSCYGMKGRHQLALDLFERAAVVRPDMPKIHVDIAKAAVQLQRNDLAREHLERALTLEGCPPEASFLLWGVYLEAGDGTRAKELMRKLLRREDLTPAERRAASQYMRRTKKGRSH